MGQRTSSAGSVERDFHNSSTTPTLRHSARQQEAANSWTTRQQLDNYFWVSQLRVDIAYAVKELSRALQHPGNEDLKNLKQLL
eukprot:436738-Amphidinium_carterae.1